MKTLILQRHAKAESIGNTDWERKLSMQGKEEAASVAALLVERKYPVDMIYSSPAKRAIKTAKIFAKIADKSISLIETVPVLYHGNCEDILSWLRNIDPRFNCLLLVGHNPILSELAELFSPCPIGVLKPADAVILQFDVSDWLALSPATCFMAQRFMPGK